MRLTFPNKTEFETDIIIDILKTENIPFTLKRNYYNSFDINVNISYEYFCFINRLTEEKIKPYITAHKSFLLPSYDKRQINMSCAGNIPVLQIALLHRQLTEMGLPCEIKIEQPRKSLLYRLTEWIRNHV